MDAPPSERELLFSPPSSILGRPAYSTMPSPRHQRGNFHGTHNREPADHRRPSNCAKHTRKNDNLSFLPAFRRSLRRESQPGSDSGPDQYNQPLWDLTIPPPEAQILDETAPARSAISKKEPLWKPFRSFSTHTQGGDAAQRWPARSRLPFAATTSPAR